jgi:hypothetical protein
MAQRVEHGRLAATIVGGGINRERLVERIERLLGFA